MDKKLFLQPSHIGPIMLKFKLQIKAALAIYLF